MRNSSFPINFPYYICIWMEFVISTTSMFGSVFKSRNHQTRDSDLYKKWDDRGPSLLGNEMG